MKRTFLKIILGLGFICLMVLLISCLDKNSSFATTDNVKAEQTSEGKIIDNDNKSETSSGEKTIGFDEIKKSSKSVGYYIKTLIKIDKDTQIDLYEVESAYNKKTVKVSAKYGSKGQKYYAGNASQIVLVEDGFKRILWAKNGFFSIYPAVGDKDNFDNVPIYDVIINNDFTELRVIYQLFTLLQVAFVDTNEPFDPLYRNAALYRTAFDDGNNWSVESSGFITPDIIRVENKNNSILYYQIIGEETKSENGLMNELLWWNGNGPKWTIKGYYDKSKSYYEGGDEPTYDESEWNDWYKMGYDYSSGKKVKLDN